MTRRWNSTGGTLALEYFHQMGFTPDTIGRFGLGYALNAWDALVRFVEASHATMATFEKGGLDHQAGGGKRLL